MTLDDWWNVESIQCCNYSENFARLGNAGEPFDLSNASLERVDLTKQDCALMMLLAEARGAGVRVLSDL